MKLSIMQPYFFPYLGYFSLIKHTDQFIIFDPVQYIRHGWIARNRILKPGEGWQYIKVPIQKHSRSSSIKDVRINNSQSWKARILGQIQHYKKKAPFFNEVEYILEDVFSGEYNSIVQLNLISLKRVCRYLNIETPLSVFSEMEMGIESPNAPDEWALNICEAISGCDEYWNPHGGIDLFDKDKYNVASIKLQFIEVMMLPYSQRRGVFEEGLSIIDVLMFNDPDSVNLMLNDFVLF